MKLKNMYIGDFGIFANSHLNNINSKINIIGGPNRSGKTTFLNIFRYLGYGFPRDSSLPPASDEYHVEADLKGETGAEYRLLLKGFSDPKLVSLGKTGSNSRREISIKELYGNLDRFTYHQLFTISLDELQRIPPDISGNKERERLYSVLLGAGLAEMVELPRISRKYFKEARTIGGKFGKPDVGRMKQYGLKIAEAEKEKKEALQRVNRYHKKKQNYQNIKKQKIEYKEEIKSLEKKKILLDVLKNNYHEYAELEELYFKLMNHEGKALDKQKFTIEKKETAARLLERLRKERKYYLNKKKQFQQRIGKENTGSLKEKLLDKHLYLEKQFSNLAGYKEKVVNYRELKKEHQQKQENLQVEAKKINSDWSGSLSEIETINTDSLEKARIIEEVEKFRKLSRDLKDALKIKRELTVEREELLERERELFSGNSRKLLYKTILFGVFSLLLGFLLGFISLPGGFILGLTGIISTVIYFLYNYWEQMVYKQRRQELQYRIEDLSVKIDIVKGEIDEIAEQKKVIAINLHKYCRELGIEDVAEETPGFIINYFTEVRQLQARYEEWKQQKEKLFQKKQDIQEELSSLTKLLFPLYSEVEDSFSEGKTLFSKEDKIIEKSEELFAIATKIKEYLKYAFELKEAETSLREIESEIDSILVIEQNEQKMRNKPILQRKTKLQDFMYKTEQAEEYRALKSKYETLLNGLVRSLVSSDRIREALCDLNLEKVFWELNEESAGKDFSGNRGDEKTPDCFEDVPGEVDSVYIPEFGEEINPAAETEEEIKINSFLLKNFSCLWRLFVSREEAENEHIQVTRKLKDLKQSTEQLEESIQKVKQELESLASPEKIETAHRKINEARLELRALAEEYAVDRSVSFILNRARERVINRARKELLQPAGEIISQLTAGEYRGVEPPEQLEGKLDFRTVLADGNKTEGSEVLSRGTAEQLFLAVRLSRIKEITPSLPVVLDDSLVNYDRFHLQRTADILKKFGEQNQLFILTCHPHLVEYFSDCENSVNCWQLKQGSFREVGVKELVTYLQT